ncbi:MAG: hypothetical protein AAF624_12960 [Bacteroidota bacterium]
MSAPTVRDRVLRAVSEMPSTITFEEVMERIYMLEKIERGRQQIAEGKGVPHDDAQQHMKRWHG